MFAVLIKGGFARMGPTRAPETRPQHTPPKHAPGRPRRGAGPDSPSRPPCGGLGLGLPASAAKATNAGRASRVV